MEVILVAACGAVHCLSRPLVCQARQRFSVGVRAAQQVSANFLTLLDSNSSSLRLENCYSRNSSQVNI